MNIPRMRSSWKRMMLMSHFVPKSAWKMGCARRERNSIAGNRIYAVKRFILVTARVNLSGSSWTEDNVGRKAEVSVCETDIMPILLHLSACV